MRFIRRCKRDTRPLAKGKRLPAVLGRWPKIRGPLAVGKRPLSKLGGFQPFWAAGQGKEATVEI